MGLNILITGGSGFIGSRLAKRLLDNGHSVTIADIRPSHEYPKLRIDADIRNLNQMLNACENIDVIYHLAAEHRDDVHPVSLYDEVNVEGSRIVCQAASQKNISKIIFTSSVAVYGFKDFEADETATTTPFNDYGRTKLEAEQVLSHWCQQSPDNQLTIVRPTVVFGENNRGNVYNLLNQIANGPFMMIGNGKNRKSMAYVENVAAFLQFCLTLDKGEHTFNYIDKPDFDMNGLVKTVKHALNKSNKNSLTIPKWLGLLAGTGFDVLARITKKRFPISAIRVKKFTADSLFSSEKALNTGFKPPVDLMKALDQTITNEFPQQ